MSDTSIEARLVALEGRVGDLERQRWECPPRLGPKPPSSDEIEERLVEAAKEALTSAGITIPVPPPVDRSNVCTTSGEPAEKVRAEQTEETGQHKSYIVLCEDERKKGFVRPYRDAYKHVGAVKEMTNDAYGDFTVRVGGCGTVTTNGPRAERNLRTRSEVLRRNILRQLQQAFTCWRIRLDRRRATGRFVNQLGGSDARRADREVPGRDDHRHDDGHPSHDDART